MSFNKKDNKKNRGQKESMAKMERKTLNIGIFHGIYLTTAKYGLEWALLIVTFYEKIPKYYSQINLYNKKSGNTGGQGD